MDTKVDCKDCKKCHLRDGGQWWPDDYVCQLGGWCFPWWAHYCVDFEFDERPVDGP